jgi:thioesterase domain-containing protein/acyl carrier protein
LSASTPIGRPLANIEARVLDEHRMPVPAGTEGELWIGGAGLGRGYCGNEQLTRERFAVLGQDGRRFYRTGDVVVADVDGTLHYFGRCDDQMKVRGVRIEPMEVESAILTCPGVTQAAATWFATASGSRSIVVAVVTGPDHTVNAEDIHRFLVRVLPSAMVPSRFVFCDALPMTPSGKVDRKAIRARVADLPADPATASGDALTVTEGTLIGIWERTLNIRPVARDDHFFTIGGDSLSAVTMMLEVEATFDISLAFRVAFEAPTLERLAERIDRAQAQQLARMNAPLQTDDLANAAFVFPLAQQGRGIPVFFNNVSLRMARKGMWNVDCPLYAVSQWAQGSGFAKAKSVEELARAQIDAIRSIQPHGPYHLAGYSFGGLVALEIAHQLRRAGETIELLFLLDPSEPFTDGYLLRAPTHGPSAHGGPERLGARIKRHVKQLAADPRHALPYIGTSALGRIQRPLWEWISYHLVHFYGRHPNPVSACLLPKNRWPAFWYTTQRLARTYNPQPYDGQVLAMFISHHERREMWQQLLGPTADIRIVDSDHLGMFGEPALSLWLQPLRARLEGGS